MPSIMSAHSLYDGSMLCLTNTINLGVTPGSNHAEVMLKNITARPITIKQGVKVAVIEAANAVPKILAPKEIGGGIEAVSKSAQGGINTKNPETTSSEPEGKPKTEVD